MVHRISVFISGLLIVLVSVLSGIDLLGAALGRDDLLSVASAASPPAGSLDVTDWSYVDSTGTQWNPGGIYDAKGDGMTDDRAAIQTCVDAAAVAGRAVYLPAGTYKVALSAATYEEQWLELPSNTHLVGEPESTIIDVADAYNPSDYRGYYNTSSDNLIIPTLMVKGVHDVIIEGITVRASGLHDYRIGVRVMAGRGLTIDDCRFENMWYGVKIGSGPQSYDVTLTDSVAVANCQALYAANLSDSTFENLTLGVVTDDDKDVWGKNHVIYLSADNHDLTFRDLTLSGGRGQSIHLYTERTEPEDVSTGISFDGLDIDAGYGPIVISQNFDGVHIHDMRAETGPTSVIIQAFGGAKNVTLDTFTCSGGEALVGATDLPDDLYDPYDPKHFIVGTYPATGWVVSNGTYYSGPESGLVVFGEHFRPSPIGAGVDWHTTAPLITGLSRTSGPSAGGATVVISGVNFLDVEEVLFGDTPASGYTVDSSTRITAVTPTHGAGTTRITVVTSPEDGVSLRTPDVPADDFTFLVDYAFLRGTDRYDTAIRLSRAVFPGALPAGAGLVVAPGETFPEALCAAPLAAAWDGPVLLTYRTSLANDVRAELERLAPSRVFCVGLSAAASAQVAAALPEATVTVLAGPDVYALCADVARELEARVGDLSGATAIITRGDLFPDAIGVAPLACARRWPIILTQGPGGALPSSSAAVLGELGITSALKVGTYATLPAQITSGGNLSGADRYATNRNVAQWALANAGLSFTHTAIATGDKFPDALASGPYLALSEGILLLSPLRGPLPAVISAQLRANAGAVQRLSFIACIEPVIGQVQALLP